MQWQKEYFYPWKLFKIFFLWKVLEKIIHVQMDLKKKKKDAMRVVLILQAAS